MAQSFEHASGLTFFLHWFFKFFSCLQRMCAFLTFQSYLKIIKRINMKNSFSINLGKNFKNSEQRAELTKVSSRIVTNNQSDKYAWLKTKCSFNNISLLKLIPENWNVFPFHEKLIKGVFGILTIFQFI